MILKRTNERNLNYKGPSFSILFRNAIILHFEKIKYLISKKLTLLITMSLKELTNFIHID